MVNGIGDDYMRTANTQHAFVVVKNEPNSIEDAVVVNKDFVDRGGAALWNYILLMIRMIPEKTLQLLKYQARVHLGKYSVDSDGPLWRERLSTNMRG